MGRDELRASKALAPRQLRSRETYAKLITASERLLARSGAGDFTLLAVSRESGVSIGGIYRRIEHREALIRAVQEKLYARMNVEYAEIEEKAAARSDSLKDLVPTLVLETAELLHRHAPLLKAIVEAAWSDAEVGKRGREIYLAHERRFRDLVLRHRDEIHHHHPEHAVNFCYNCIWENVASHFGFGHRESSESHRWTSLVSDLQRLCFSFLTVSLPPEFLAPSERRRAVQPAGPRRGRKPRTIRRT